ncbi:MAG: energy transducer TonB [Acidobacteriota bacterium]
MSDAKDAKPAAAGAAAGKAKLTASEERLQTYMLEEAEDNKTLRIAGVVAVLFHLGLLVVQLPELLADEPEEAEKPKVYVVQQVRFKPPPPKEEKEIPKPKAKKVPIPDPTPDEPEPIRIEEPEEFDIPEVDDLIIGIPEAPPEPEPTGPIYVTGDVQKPEKISSVPPQYTEIARKARIQGVVILQSIIDEQGNVTDVSVLKGLPMGLSEAATEAVKQWKYKPATLNGKPVAVYFNLTVNFQLQ